MRRARRRAGRAVVLTFVGALTLVLAGCDQLTGMLGSSPAQLAVKRVDFILGTLKSGVSGTSREMQTAICRWDADVVLVDRDSLGVAVDAFDRWRRAGGFYDRVESYEVDPEVEPADPGDPEGTFYVFATVNGAGRWLRVPPKARISWVDEGE